MDNFLLPKILVLAPLEKQPILSRRALTPFWEQDMRAMSNPAPLDMEPGAIAPNFRGPSDDSQIHAL